MIVIGLRPDWGCRILVLRSQSGSTSSSSSHCLLLFLSIARRYISRRISFLKWVVWFLTLIHKPIVDTTRCSVYLKTVDCCPSSVPVLELNLYPGTWPEVTLCMIFVYLHWWARFGLSPTFPDFVWKPFWLGMAMPSVCAETFGC